MLKFISRILFGGTYKVAHIDSAAGLTLIKNSLPACAGFVFGVIIQGDGRMPSRLSFINNATVGKTV